MSNPDANGDRQVQTRLIVKFKESARTSKTELDAHCQRIGSQIPGGHLVRPPSRSGRAVFDVESSANLKELADRISKLDGVDYAEPDILDSAS